MYTLGEDLGGDARVREVAVEESGGADDPVQVTIVPRGGTGGSTWLVEGDVTASTLP